MYPIKKKKTYSVPYGLCQAKKYFEHVQNVLTHTILHVRQSLIKAFCSQLKHPKILFADSEGPDHCADAQPDLGLPCPHMPKDTFLHGVAHITLYIYILTNVLLNKLRCPVHF